MGMRPAVVTALLFLCCSPCTLVGQEKPTLPAGFAVANSNAVRVGVDFGKQFGCGVILTPFGVAVTCKHVIAGFNDGRVELPNGAQVEFKVLSEAEGKDLVFLVTRTPVDGVAVSIRENTTLSEGEELVCRASVGQGPICTIRGSLAYLPRQASSGVLAAQLPLSPGSSGTALFDLNGHVVGICIGPISEKETSFARAWSGDVIRDAIKGSFGDSWKRFLPEVAIESREIKSNNGKSDLRVGDKIESINGTSVNSDCEFLLAGAALSARNETRVQFGVVRGGKRDKIDIVRQ